MVTFHEFCLTGEEGPAEEAEVQRFDRLSFLLQAEMGRWARSTPTPPPEDLFSWGVEWALKNDTTLTTSDASEISQDAFVGVAAGHSSVRPVLSKFTALMLAQARDAFIANFGYFPPRGFAGRRLWLRYYLALASIGMADLILGRELRMGLPDAFTGTRPSTAVSGAVVIISENLTAYDSEEAADAILRAACDDTARELGFVHGGLLKAGTTVRILELSDSGRRRVEVLDSHAKLISGSEANAGRRVW